MPAQNLALPPLVPPAEFVRLASELVAEYEPPETVLQRWGLGPPATDPRTQELFDSPGFQAIYEQVQREFEGADNTIKRIRMKSAVLVEAALPVISDMIHSDELGAKDRLDAFRQAAKMAGVETPDAKIDDGSKFIINISVPGADADTPSTPMVTIEASLPSKTEPPNPFAMIEDDQ